MIKAYCAVCNAATEWDDAISHCTRCYTPAPQGKSTETGEYPLRTLDEMRAASERGDEICIDGKRVAKRSAVLVDSDDLITLTSTGWTARPLKPKEFDLWEAMRAVSEGRASKAERANDPGLCFTREGRGAVVWCGSGGLGLVGTYTMHTEAKWTLYGNDGKPVYE